MSLFDLLFLVAALVTVITLATAGVIALQGYRAKAFRILRVYGICLVTYLATALSVDFFTPQRVIAPGLPWCFDDWCLQVRRLHRTRIGSRRLISPKNIVATSLVPLGALVSQKSCAATSPTKPAMDTINRKALMFTVRFRVATTWGIIGHHHGPATCARTFFLNQGKASA
jgi:hypothetical protein